MIPFLAGPALEKYGIPEPMLNLVQSLHDHMKAEVTVNGQVAPEFEVCNRLRQGCDLSPTMFKLYINLMWKMKCVDFGVDVLYKCGGKLVGERKRRSYKERVTELQFSGDLATIETRESYMHTTRLA